MPFVSHSAQDNDPVVQITMTSSCMQYWQFYHFFSLDESANS